MGKRKTKSEKLDLILAELSRLSDEVKKLSKRQAPASDATAKSRSKASATPKKTSKAKPALKPTAKAIRPEKPAKHAKPVLVQPSAAPEPTSRTVAQ